MVDKMNLGGLAMPLDLIDLEFFKTAITELIAVLCETRDAIILTGLAVTMPSGRDNDARTALHELARELKLVTEPEVPKAEVEKINL
jgi:hypothetical protein